MTKAAHPRRVARVRGSWLAEGWDPRSGPRVLAPWCIMPLTREVRSDFYQGLPSKAVSSHRQYMTIAVACRRCDGCKVHRRKLWAARAYDEVRLANRTWFGTLTLAPQVQVSGLFEARAYARKRGLGDFDALGRSEQFRLLAGIHYPHVQRFLKRLRKAGAKFRYLLVAEEHQSGLPHYHLLLHERTSDNVLKSTLEGQWRAGFSHWRLVDEEKPRQVFYVVKYLGKSIPTRVWNSCRYGSARTADNLAQATSLAGEVAHNTVKRADTTQVVQHSEPALTSDLGDDCESHN